MNLVLDKADLAGIVIPKGVPMHEITLSEDLAHKIPNPALLQAGPVRLSTRIWLRALYTQNYNYEYQVFLSVSNDSFLKEDHSRC